MTSSTMSSSDIKHGDNKTTTEESTGRSSVLLCLLGGSLRKVQAEHAECLVLN